MTAFFLIGSRCGTTEVNGKTIADSVYVVGQPHRKGRVRVIGTQMEKSDRK